MGKDDSPRTNWTGGLTSDMRLLQLITAWLALCSPSLAAEVTPAVGRLWVMVDGNVSASGSCVLVSDHIAVTASHVVGNAPDKAVFAVRFRREGALVFAYKATVLESRPDFDLAVLRIEGSVSVTPRPISFAPVKEGRKIWQSGWGNRDRRPRSVWGVVGTSGVIVEDNGPVFFESTPWASGGDSGGGIFDENGYLIGIISMVDTGAIVKNGHRYKMPNADRRTYAAPLSENQWIKKHLGSRNGN